MCTSSPPCLFDESYLKSRKLQDESLIFLFLWHEGYRLTLSFQDVHSGLPLTVRHFCTTICLCVRSRCGMSGGPSWPKWWGTCVLTCLGFSHSSFPVLIPDLLLDCLSLWFQWNTFWSESDGWGVGGSVERREKYSIAVFRQLRICSSDLAKCFGIEPNNTFSCFSRCLMAPKGINQLCGNQRGLGKAPWNLEDRWKEGPFLSSRVVKMPLAKSGPRPGL